MQQIKSVLDPLKKEFLNELFDLLRFKSISTQDAHKPDILACAEFVNKKFKTLGLDSAIFQTKGHPLVFAQTKIDPNKKTVLNHAILI